MPQTKGMRVFVKLPMGYGRYGNLSRGQVFTLEGAPNDDRLLRLGHVVRIGAKDEVYACGDCGAEFAAPGYRDAHGRIAHPYQELTEEDLERIEDREQALLDRELQSGSLLNLPTSLNLPTA